MLSAFVMIGNGNAFRAFVAESVAVLQDVKAIDYYQRPLPDPLDDKFAEMVAVFQSTTGELRTTFAEAFTDKQRALFGIYGHRAATLAVREENRDKLLSGLVGAAIANYTIPDKRNLAVSLAVYHYCARKLGMNTVDLFDKAAAVASAEFAPIAAQYGRRSDVTLKMYGWREIKTPDGVKYKFDW
ncbi:MAG: hypothetical protein CSA11_01045 [Chloroflexi bacterium]|nr:MAG: hypothetical protein CSA11_01045 [Chloroflexota bacterium]